jgi:hypothetical protein
VEVGRYTEALKRLWTGAVDWLGALLEEVAFRLEVAFKVLVGRVPLERAQHKWLRHQRTPVEVTVYDWSTNRLLFSVIIWPPLEREGYEYLEDFEERIQDIKQVIATGVGERGWSTLLRTNYGLEWDHRREVWTDGQGHHIDGSKFGPGKPRLDSGLKSVAS